MPDANDPGLLTPAETSLLIDRYEITMAASYHRLGRNEPAVFELFVRKLPPHRDWLVVCGLGPTLRLIAEMRFGPAELEYLGTLGYKDDFLRYLEGFRFGGVIDAMPEGGELAVRTRRTANAVVIDIADSGQGLTDEERRRLFTPHYTTKQHGTGLGLAIVQSVVTDHFGKVWVESEPGRGATFHVELPA